MQRHTRSFANFERPELFGQPLLNPVELAQVRKNRQPQQTQRLGIGLHDAAPFVHDHNAGNDPFEDQLIIFLALDRLVLGLDQQLLDPVERPVEQVVRKRTAVTGELKGIVVVFDRIEHKRDLARIGPIEPENTAEQQTGDGCRQDSVKPEIVDNQQGCPHRRRNQQQQHQRQLRGHSPEHP